MTTFTYRMIALGTSVVGFAAGLIAYNLSFVFVPGFQMSMFEIMAPMIGLGLAAIIVLIKESK